jgi:hypothetical protein
LPRAEQSWPPTIRTLPHWPAIYDRAREGLNHLDLAETAAEAAARVQLFVTRIDQSAASELAARDNLTDFRGLGVLRCAT